MIDARELDLTFRRTAETTARLAGFGIAPDCAFHLRTSINAGVNRLAGRSSSRFAHARLALRLAAQYFVMRALTALLWAADMRRVLRLTGAGPAFRFNRPAPLARMNDTGSSSGSNESFKAGKAVMRALASSANSRRRTSAPR